MVILINSKADIDRLFEEFQKNYVANRGFGIEGVRPRDFVEFLKMKFDVCDKDFLQTSVDSLME